MILMGTVQRIKDLADAKQTTFAEIERKIGISNGQIRRWDKVSPKAENIKKVADYFDVSVDYLLERTEKALPTKKQQSTDLDEILDGMMSFDGKPMTDHDREAIRAYLQGRFSNK